MSPLKPIRATFTARCVLCPFPVLRGQLLAKDFDHRSWVHMACWTRKVNAPVKDALGEPAETTKDTV